MIRAHVGQRVLYWPRLNEVSYPHKQPFVGFVTHTHSHHLVNLFVVSDTGVPFVRVNVQLRHAHEVDAGDCCYPPYSLDPTKTVEYPEGD